MAGGINRLISKIYTLRHFNHENVLPVTGVYFDTFTRPLIVMPFMENGTLLNYLQNQVNSPALQVLIAFGYDIARGMQYLNSIGILHGNLATRNCL